MMAYITRFIFGTDKLRPNAFEVRGMNGSNTGVIHVQDLAVLSHWIKLISEYITALTHHKGKIVFLSMDEQGTIPNCRKFRIFLSLRFYVKLILDHLEILRLAILIILCLYIVNLVIFSLQKVQEFTNALIQSL